MIAHCRCTPMPLNSATAPAYTADAAKMATSQLRPIAATDPGAAADPGAASLEGLPPPLRSCLKASRDAHILHLTSPSRFLAAPRRGGRFPGWTALPACAGQAARRYERRRCERGAECERPRLLHGRPAPGAVPGP